MWGPEYFVQTTTGAVVHHSDVVFTLVNTEVMSEADYMASANITSLPHLDNLGPHLLMLRWVSLHLLRLKKHPELARHKMWLAVSDVLLILFRPVPKERC